MSDEQLTATLAVRVLGWRIAPGRFIKPNRTWCPQWRFSPLKDLECAFELLDHVADCYTLRGTVDGKCDVEVKVGDRVANASGGERARTLTLALAHALGLNLPNTSEILVSGHIADSEKRSY